MPQVLPSPVTTNASPPTVTRQTPAWHRWVTIGAYTLTALIMLGLFVQNFVFSESFSLLGFREIDDVAFQLSLRRLHHVIASGHLRPIWHANGYGYGWFYWLPMAIITYPAYWLSTVQHIDWPLIVLPRQASWLMGVGCLALLRGMLRQYKTPDWACAVGVLLFALFPSFGYFCLRFGTVQHVTFFSMLSVYWAIKPYSRKQLVKVAMALAMAGAIKLSGLLVAPVALGLACLRLPPANVKTQLKRLVLPAILGSITLFVLTNPAFLSFKPAVFTAYWNNLNHFIEITKRSDGLPTDWHRLWAGVYVTPLTAAVQWVLMLGLVVWQRHAIPRNERLILFIGLLGIAAYLMLSVKQGLSIGFYFTALSYIGVLGLAGFYRYRLALPLFSLLVGLSLLDVYQRFQTQTYIHHTAYFQKAQQAAPTLQLADKLMVELSKKTPLSHVMIDYTIPIKLNGLTHPDTCMTTMYNNFSVKNKSCVKSADFIILDTQANIGAKSDQAFKSYIRLVDRTTAIQALQDRSTRQNLIKNGRFDNMTYKCQSKINNVIVFKRIN